MRLPRFLLGLVAATAVHVLGLKLAAGFARWLDPFLVLVVYHSLEAAPAAAILGGSLAGLARDALTGGTYGLNGFADTVAAYAVAAIEQRFVLQRPLQVGFLFALTAALVQLILAAVAVFLLTGVAPPEPDSVAWKMATAGGLGMLLVFLRNRLRGWQRGRRDPARRKLRLPPR